MGKDSSLSAGVSKLEDQKSGFSMGAPGTACLNLEFSRGSLRDLTLGSFLVMSFETLDPAIPEAITPQALSEPKITLFGLS